MLKQVPFVNGSADESCDAPVEVDAPRELLAAKLELWFVAKIVAMMMAAAAIQIPDRNHSGLPGWIGERDGVV